MYDLTHWTVFLSAAVFLNLAPGPDIAFILGHTVRSGARNGFAAMFGIWTGALCHVLLTASGLSAILVASPTAFAAIKWIGVAYLLWLGFQTLRHAGGSFVGSGICEQGMWQVFRQGVLVDLLNPKVAIFFLAFLPQFVEPGAGSVWAQLLLHGVLIIAVAAVIEPPLVLAGARLTGTLRNSPELGRRLDLALGALLIGLAAWLALTAGIITVCDRTN